jgi:hypothetical protein
MVPAHRFVVVAAFVGSPEVSADPTAILSLLPPPPTPPHQGEGRGQQAPGPLRRDESIWKPLACRHPRPGSKAGVNSGGDPRPAATRRDGVDGVRPSRV